MKDDDDIFDCVTIRLTKPESRPIVGSYAQRTIPFRSASFSQVDFSSADGKYIRSNIKSSPFSCFPSSSAGGTPLPLSATSVIAGGSLTLPRKKLPDVPAVCAEEPGGSTPSVDSAVGSDEGSVTTATSKIPIISKSTDSSDATHKVPGSRSLTYPLPRRGTRPDDVIPFSSIDGNGLKSLQYVTAGRELHEVQEESETSLADSQQSSCSQDVVGGTQHSPEGEIAHDWRKSEECHLTCEPPVCLGELVVSSSDKCAQTAAAELSAEHSYEHCAPESEDTRNTSQTEEQFCVQTSEEDKIIYLVSDANSSDVVKVENYPALEEESLNGCQENADVLQECLSVGYGKTLASEDTGQPRVLEENGREVYITQWPNNEVQDASDTKEVLEVVKPLSQEDFHCMSGDWSDVQIENCNAKPSTDVTGNKAEEPEKTRYSDSSQVEESCTDVEDNPPTHTVSIVSPQWQRSEEWDSAQEESLSPDEGISSKVQWPRSERWLEKPKLVYQSSEEREEDSTAVPRRFRTPVRADSLSEGESDQGDRCPVTRDCTASPSPFAPSDLSDSEGRTGGSAGSESRSPHTPRRYSKRPLRGPYGQMLEAEMSKAETNRMSKLQLEFLEKYVSSPPDSSRSSPAAPESANSNNSRPRALTTQSLDDSQLKGGYGRSSPASTPSRPSPKRKVSANIPYSAPHGETQSLQQQPQQPQQQFVCHQRTTSSPSQLEGYSGTSPRPELLAELLRGSSERMYNGSSVQHGQDTRTHVVVEIYDTERSYVESLQILVMKYLQPLKSPENAGLVDSAVVDAMFYQIPAILAHHEVFLEELRKRLQHWDIKQKVGDVFLDVFTKKAVIETYTLFLNNFKTAKEAIKATCQAKPAFARFLEAMAREHKGKLALDCLLIMPVQRIPRYELLIQTLLKHTDPSHPDHQLLYEAQREVHDLAMKINCTERETLKELEALIEGLINLVAADRTFIRHDLVTMVSGQGTRKERALFLFSDLLVITSIKRRSGTIRKPSTSCPGSVASTLEANKYKLLMRIPLDDLEIVKAKDENLRRMLNEMENLAEDVTILNQINDLIMSLHCPHGQLEEVIREMLSSVNKQLIERQTSDSQLSYLELTLSTQNGIENLSVVFTKPDKRTSWEESFNEAKQKLALSADRRPSPEFLSPLPIRKTRAGLQFTCAAPTLGLNAYNMRDVWVCNSDGYVGQVCVLSLQPEPTVISCNGVCNARILCIASIPTGIMGLSSSCSIGQPFTNSKAGISISVEDTDESGGNTVQLDSSSSEDEDEGEEGMPGPGISISVEEDPKRIRSASDSLVCETSIVTEDTDSLQPTMWLGTEDGCIHVYNCSDNIRIKKNKVKIQHGSSVHSIIYLDNRVFVSLANGDITVYVRDHNGGWNTTDPFTVSVGTAATPVTRMLPIAGKLWCGCHNAIKILNTASLEVEHSFQVNSDSSRAVTCIALSGLGVWISLQNSAVVRLFHAMSYEPLCDVNVAPAVTKMLASCDDIIRQHKAACLRVTSLLACKDLLWIGTSAGVILTMPLPHITPATTKLANVPNATGVPHGHTGHVRFLTFVETVPAQSGDSLMVRSSAHHRHSMKSKPELQSSSNTSVKLLVISGGDGYEDFRTSSVSEVAGREDSTNHLLLWHV
ncbi:rho guanine nucleotide exchange factor 17 isoform X2 [Zootermopsis nevadensis]|uniref:rho guanine nucleotide exchange factor 17 isoform X2 n=1 Tax=Zootermopsis nevadensis TaxID=136037 RepID=UPI000B8E8DE8|nr:rho guanine nucleotide exchange factor 17 isoform X2 [Zootermopsis nevadensis]